MTRQNVNEFKYACREFLSKQGIAALRPYGREVGVAEPTKKNKEELISAIVAVLAGEIAPIPRSKKGAPVKDDFVDPNIHEYMAYLCKCYPAVSELQCDDLDIQSRLKELKEHPFILKVEDPNARALERKESREIFKGQLETLNGVSMLLPLNCMNSVEKIIISVELIRVYSLREGDVVTCHAEKRNNVLVAIEVLTINELIVDSFKRVDFESSEVHFPEKSIHFYSEKYNSPTSKYLQWLIPMAKGQRGLVLAPPKAGKSSLLLESVSAALKLNKSMRVFTLLVDQSPENIGLFRKVTGGENFVYTTYEDEPDRQVFVAEFILKRAKRYAECGLDVLLVVDSFSALAHAYNETDASVGGKLLLGGLESKTVHYLKRFFGTARCLGNGGSVTILGALAVDTGNPMDEILKAELSSIGNLEVSLSDELAKRRIYPSIDLVHSQRNHSSIQLEERERAFDAFLRSSYLPAFGNAALLELLKQSSSFEELEEKVYQAIK